MSMWAGTVVGWLTREHRRRPRRNEEKHGTLAGGTTLTPFYIKCSHLVIVYYYNVLRGV